MNRQVTDFTSSNIALAPPPTRPALRWHGQKWLLAPWIIAHLPAHRIYVEPYMGGAAVLLRKSRSYAEVINDLDGDLVNLFRVLRDPAAAERLAHLLRLTPYARDEWAAAYVPAADPIERARRMVVRSFQSFGSAGAMDDHNTGFRANSNRRGSTPAHDWANYPDALCAITARLRGVIIENRDALDVIRQHDNPDACLYVDPPYVHSTRCNQPRGVRQVYRHEMSDTDHERLAQVLHDARGFVVLSGYRCPLYDTLYADWRRVDRGTHADGAADRVESLWLSPRAAANAGQLSFVAE